MQFRTIQVGGNNALFVRAWDELSANRTQVLNGNDRMNPGQSVSVLVNVDANGNGSISWSTINADTRVNSGSGTSQAAPFDPVVVE